MHGVVPVPGIWDASCVDERVLDRSKALIDGGARDTSQSLRMKLGNHFPHVAGFDRRKIEDGWRVPFGSNFNVQIARRWHLSVWHACAEHVSDWEPSAPSPCRCVNLEVGDGLVCRGVGYLECQFCRPHPCPCVISYGGTRAGGCDRNRLREPAGIDQRVVACAELVVRSGWNVVNFESPGVVSNRSSHRFLTTVPCSFGESHLHSRERLTSVINDNASYATPFGSVQPTAPELSRLRA